MNNTPENTAGTGRVESSIEAEIDALAELLPPVHWRRAPSDDDPDRTGDTSTVEDYDPRESELEIPAGPVGDLVTAGHGFLIETHGSPGRDPNAPLRFCCVCGDPVRIPATQWRCEFSGDVTERPVFMGYGRNGPRPNTKCGCNRCALSHDVRGRGHPREVCIAPECERQRARVQRAAERERQNQRHRDTAIRWIVADPSLSDQHIADQIGTRPIRVKEARRELSGVIH